MKGSKEPIKSNILSGWNRSNPAFTAMSFKEPTKKTVYPSAICTIIIVSSISYETLPTETVSEKTQKSNGVDEKYASLDLTDHLYGTFYSLLKYLNVLKFANEAKSGSKDDWVLKKIKEGWGGQFAVPHRTEGVCCKGDEESHHFFVNLPDEKLIHNNFVCLEKILIMFMLQYFLAR